MTPDRLDVAIRVSFAIIVFGVALPQITSDPGNPIPLFLILGGLAGVAVAGFWRARVVRRVQTWRAVVSEPVVHVAVPAEIGARRSETLRDLGLISFLLGLLLFLVASFVAFVSRPDPNVALAGVIVTTFGALALAQRYRFFAVLVACFVVPVGLIGAFVVWPPVFWLVPAVALAWSVTRLWRRGHPRPGG